MKTYNEIKQRIVDLDELLEGELAFIFREQILKEIEILRWVLGEIP